MFVRQMTGMKKKETPGKKKYSYDIPPSIMEEPMSEYRPMPRSGVITKDYTYSKFKKLYEQSGFSLKDWAGFLHLSERTLLRYAKENTVFEGIYLDRLLQLEKLFTLGNEVFGSPKEFNDWIRWPRTVLGNKLDIDSLKTSDGINDMYAELLRIQHGVYI
jgi:Protein of unknown function (DUF2384)